MTDGQYFQYYLTLFSILFSILIYIINENKYSRRARVLIPPGYLHPGKRKH